MQQQQKKKSGQINRLNFPFDPASGPRCSGWPPLREYGRIPGRTLPRKHSWGFQPVWGISLDSMSQYEQHYNRLRVLCPVYLYFKQVSFITVDEYNIP